MEPTSQEGASAAADVTCGKTLSFQLVDKVDLNHIEHISYFDLFTASKSGAVAVVCPEGSPSLSVVYPGTDRPPVLLSEDQAYSSALFINICKGKSGVERELQIEVHRKTSEVQRKSSVGPQEVQRKSSVGPQEMQRKTSAWQEGPENESASQSQEYIAATCTSDKSIHLWNLEDLTFNVVCNMKTTETSELMNLCIIDDTTIAYGDMKPKPDGTHRVYIMKTSTDGWSLRSILNLDVKNIGDMCFVKATDGTPCLVLSCPSEHYVTAVQLVGGETRWTSGEDLMGKECCPWSICTDRINNTIYVADFVKHKLFLLSPEDGTITDSVDLRQFDVIKPFCVRIEGDFIYVSHVGRSRKKKQITKLKKNKD